MKRNNKKYSIESLQVLFYIGKTENGEWRVFHAADRGRADGSGRQIKRGEVADENVTSKGYRCCTRPQIDNVRSTTVLAHIVIWVLYHQMEVPDDMDVDHKNRVKIYNDPEKNLRLLAHRSNTINSKSFAKGMLNVETHRHKAENKKRFSARVVDPATGNRKYLGIYFTAEEAMIAADDFVVKAYGPSAPTNVSMGFLK